jgi:hypothetical protein
MSALFSSSTYGSLLALIKEKLAGAGNGNSLTAAQIEAINSGITEFLTTKLNGLPDNAALTASLAGKITAPNAQTANTQLLVAPATKGAAPSFKPISDFIQKIILTPAMVTAQGFTSLRQLVQYYPASVIGLQFGTISAFTDLPAQTAAFGAGWSTAIEVVPSNTHPNILIVTLTVLVGATVYRFSCQTHQNGTDWGMAWIDESTHYWETLTFTPATNYTASGITAKLNRSLNEIGLRFWNFTIPANRTIGEQIGQLTIPSGVSIPNNKLQMLVGNVAGAGRISLLLSLESTGNLFIHEMLPTVQNGANGLAIIGAFGQVRYALDV